MLSRLSLIACLAACALGCGHPATPEECELIFEKSAELALRAASVTDPERISQRIADAKEAKGEELAEGCVGKRITDAAMECVAQAESSEELDRCLQRWW